MEGINFILYLLEGINLFVIEVKQQKLIRWKRYVKCLYVWSYEEILVSAELIFLAPSNLFSKLQESQTATNPLMSFSTESHLHHIKQMSQRSCQVRFRMSHPINLTRSGRRLTFHIISSWFLCGSVWSLMRFIYKNKISYKVYLILPV